MLRTRVKICGITRPEDAILAAELGADAIGLNFFAGPRRISLRQGFEITTAIPPLATVVGLTSGPTGSHPDAPTVQEIRAGYRVGERQSRLRIHTFQIYGDGYTAIANLPPEEAVDLWGVYHFVDCYGLSVCPWLKNFFPKLIVVDTPARGILGGTGKTLDWPAVADAGREWAIKDMPPIVLAGGLTPENVTEAIRIARPWAVDVSSGVEVAGKPGIKDPIRMRDFIQAAQGA